MTMTDRIENLAITVASSEVGSTPDSLYLSPDLYAQLLKEYQPMMRYSSLNPATNPGTTIHRMVTTIGPLSVRVVKAYGKNYMWIGENHLMNILSKLKVVS